MLQHQGKQARRLSPKLTRQESQRACLHGWKWGDFSNHSKYIPKWRIVLVCIHMLAWLASKRGEARVAAQWWSYLAHMPRPWVLAIPQKGCWDGSESKGIYHRAWQPEFNPQDPPVEREPQLLQVVFQPLHGCYGTQYTYTHTHKHIYAHNK